MRIFYVFKIREEYATLTKSNPYHLYKMFSYIYNLDEDEIDYGIELFNKLSVPFNIKKIDLDIFKKEENNYFYTKFKNVHKINNIYRKEESILTVHKRFLQLKSSVIKSAFIKDLEDYSNLFFCDFVNKDYFWLDNLLSWSWVMS